MSHESFLTIPSNFSPGIKDIISSPISDSYYIIKGELGSSQTSFVWGIDLVMDTHYDIWIEQWSEEKKDKHAKLCTYNTLIRYKVKSFDFSTLYVIAYHWPTERFIYITTDKWELSKFSVSQSYSRLSEQESQGHHLNLLSAKLATTHTCCESSHHLGSIYNS